MVNVRAVEDVACAVPLTGVFGPRIEEFLIDNGHRAPLRAVPQRPGDGQAVLPPSTG